MKCAHHKLVGIREVDQFSAVFNTVRTPISSRISSCEQTVCKMFRRRRIRLKPFE
ncbi:hypothetical protein PO124_07345 [Bacillus licheniformis]|nr:hypothetical protein [Bacillus licheniformis]